MKNKVNSVFDVLKIILALMVVFLHGKVLLNEIYPWVRIAVPLFFIMSSYFLFSKLNKEKDTINKKEIIKTFIKRNLKLYLIWFIILLPVTLANRKYFINFSVPHGLLHMLKDFLISSTFASSWYIMSLVEGVILVYFGSKKFNNKLLLIISFLSFAFITIISTYSFIVPDIKLIKLFKYFAIKPTNTFLVGLLWVVIGKIFADNKDKMKNYNKKINIILIISGILLFLEWYFIKIKLNDTWKDCYFMLIPFTISIFYIVLHIKPFYFKESLLLRKMSTVIYVSHKSFMFIYQNWVVVNNSYVVILLSILSSVILTFIVDYLSKHIKFMKNAY